MRTFVYVASLFIALSSLALSAAKAAGPRYAFTQLQTVSTAVGMYATAYDINDSGVAVGSEAMTVSSGTSIDRSKIRPLTWASGSASATALPNVPGYGGEAYAINNAGVAVGASASTAGTSAPRRATVFRANGSVLVPGHTTGNFSLAADINDAGLAVGTDSALPFAFNTTTNADQPLNRNNVYWTPEAINEAGTIVASGGSTGSGIVRPARLSASAAPGFLYAAANAGSALDVNESGIAVGQYDTGSSNYRPAILSNGIVQTLNVDSISSGSATAINDRGRVVGWTRTFAGVTDAFVYENGVLTSLATLVNNLPAGVRIVANAINNRGQIVGQTTFDDDNNPSTPAIRGAFRLDPIHTPGDTNHDDKVDFADLLTLAKNYGKTGNRTVFWETGDFNFDWSVDFGDLLALAKNYDALTPSGAIVGDAAFAANWSLAQSLVPEPSALLGAALATTLVRRRRPMAVIA